MERFRDWRRRLLHLAGCHFSTALWSSGVVTPPLSAVVASGGLLKPIPRSLETYCLFSDAASEAESAGLGGWVHGEWLQLALSA